ncbi:MAG: DUF1573 domain-containing protein [Flavobacteriales bacterium]|nr:DUF1573 domain-containing protein [Flavobacteriales bacterium]
MYDLKRNSRSLLLSMAALTVLTCFNSCGSGNTSGSDTDLIKNNKTASDPDADNPEPILKFEEEIWDFGRITEGEIVKHSFKFVNAGNETLVINRCSASCGCTTPVCPTQPIKPGESGEITIRFDSHNRLNSQTKNITILANTVPPETVITIKGFVMPSS